MNKRYAIILFALCLTGFFSCSTQEPIADQVLLDSFTKGAESLNTEFNAFHESDDSTRFYIKINTEKLLYAKNMEGLKQASLIIKFEPKVIDGESRNEQTKSIRIIDASEIVETKTLLGSTLLYLPKGSNYEMKVSVTDENSNKTFQTKFTCAKIDKNARDNFIVATNQLDNPLFTDRIIPNTTYKLKTAKTDKRALFVRYYNRTFPLPLPPFVPYEHESFNYTADSLFTIPLDDFHTGEFTSTQSGFYHFQLDTTQTKEGFSLFISSNEYPEVKSIENMIGPFRYLVGKKDFKSILDAENQRAVLESFWLDWAGSKDIARKSIKSYYGRIEESNKLFGSYIEGWKTDRGIVYAIYGKPNKVYVLNHIETWIYGEEQNPMSITFTFVQVINPFSNNDYRLIRDEIFKPSWYHSLNACRNGKK